MKASGRKATSWGLSDNLDGESETSVQPRDHSSDDLLGPKRNGSVDSHAKSKRYRTLLTVLYKLKPCGGKGEPEKRQLLVVGGQLELTDCCGPIDA